VRIAIASVVGVLVGALIAPAVAHAATPLGPRAGVNAGSQILWVSDQERRADLNFIAATGAKWFTLDIDWASIQPTRNSWNWSYTDRVVREARARGLQIIGTLAYTPRWAQSGSCPAGTTHCLPANAVEYALFAAAAAIRYGNNSPIAGLRGSITTWQIWNEPNHYPFVRPVVDVAKYAEMLKVSYYFIKLNDPVTTVLAGATSPAPDDPSGRDMAPVTFLRALYYLGARGFFDAFAHHPYSFPCSPLIEAPWNAFYQTASLYLTMAIHGDGAKKIWGTESGAPTGADVGTCTANNGVSVSEATQAWFVHEYLWGWTVKYGAFTGPLIWHHIRNQGTNPLDRDHNFGLLRRDYTAKPSFQVFSAMMRGY
jgi:hypothetical protein